MSDVLVLLKALEKQGEDNIWRTALAARKEIERLRAELEELIDAAKAAIPPAEYPAEETPHNWAWQIRTLGADRREAYRIAGLGGNEQKLPEAAVSPTCSCKKSDRWRCAVDQNLPVVACPCSCHQRQPAQSIGQAFLR